MSRIEGFSCAGRSLLEMLWEELDRVTDLMFSGDESEFPKLEGQVQGLAFAIATIEQPYVLNVEGVKERATERYMERAA